jgi:hypothetical protein
MKMGNRMLLWILIGTATVVSASAQVPETWLGGVPPIGQQVRHISDPTYMQMFEPNAPWKVSGAGLTVFYTSMQWIQNGTDAQLHLMIDAVRARHLKFGVEMGLMSGPVGGCGKGIEGFNAPGLPRKVLERFKALGGVVDYVGMDEPVLYGHRPLGPKGAGCKFPLDQLADMIAGQINSLREVFPDLKVGDIEPIGGGAPGAELNHDVLQFAQMLRQRTHGAAPAFFHADIQWATPGSLQTLDQLAQGLHVRHIPVGVICNGGGKGVTTGQQWVANAIQRCKALSEDKRLAADHYVVQTWETLPNKMLPETDPGSLTYGLKRIEAAVGVAAKN